MVAHARWPAGIDRIARISGLNVAAVICVEKDRFRRKGAGELGKEAGHSDGNERQRSPSGDGGT
jgi:hypothetical protein